MFTAEVPKSYIKSNDAYKPLQQVDYDLIGNTLFYSAELLAEFSPFFVLPWNIPTFTIPLQVFGTFAALLAPLGCSERATECPNCQARICSDEWRSLSKQMYTSRAHLTNRSNSQAHMQSTRRHRPTENQQLEFLQNEKCTTDRCPTERTEMIAASELMRTGYSVTSNRNVGGFYTKYRIVS